jgi:hypothetical protein
MTGENLDLSSGPAPKQPARQSSDSSSQGGRYLGVQFACCGVYARIYVNSSGTAYEGRCPRCCRPLLVAIGPGGTSERFFTAY